MTRAIPVLVFQLFVLLLVGAYANVGSGAAMNQVTQSGGSSLAAAASGSYPLDYCLQLNNMSRFYYYSSSPCYSSYSGSRSPYYYYYNQPYYYGNYPDNYPYYNPYNYGYYTYSYRYDPYSYGYHPYFYSGNYYSGDYSSTPKTFELKVETNPTGVAAVNGAGTYDQGTVASFSVTSPMVSNEAGERYIFSHWSGDFSGTSPGGTVTVDSAKTVIANYELQNYLDVSADPQGIVSVTGSDWYSADASVTVGSVPPVVSGMEGTRNIFQGWTIDAVPASGNTVSITMDKPHTVVAQYRTQYLLTVSSEYGIAEGTGWYDAGSSATFSVAPRVDTSYGVSQVFDRWTGDSESTSPTGTIRMDSPRTVDAVWRIDSTVLYATIALAVGGAFVLGIGLAAAAIMRRPRGKGMKDSETAPPSRVVTDSK